MTTTNTSTAQFSKTVQELIRKELEDELRPTLPHLSPGNFIKATFVKGSNNTMRFLRMPDLSVTTNSGTISAGTPPWLTEGTAPSAEALSFGYEEFSAGQAGRRVELTDLAMDGSPLDLAGKAAEKIALNAKQTVDEFVGRKMAAGTSVIYAGSGNTARTDLTSTDVVTGQLLRRAVQTMKADSIPMFGDGKYHAIVNPAVVFDIEDDSDIGGWLAAATYGGPNGNGLLTGEIGQYAGIRFMESANARSFAAGAGDGSDVYSTSVLGTESYAFGDWGTVTTHVVLPGGHGDELAQVMSVGWKGRFGAFVIGEGDNATSASSPRYLRIESCSGL
jgi:N4-gp56 family major capsid protein